MKNIIPFLIITGIILFVSCKKDEQPTPAAKMKIQDSVEIITDTISLDPELLCLDWTKIDSISIINDSASFQVLLNKILLLPICDSFSLPIVDFNLRTVLGRKIHAGDAVEIVRSFKKFTFEKKVVFHIETKEFFDSLVVDKDNKFFNFYSIPKIPSDYSIVFDSTYIRINR